MPKPIGMTAAESRAWLCLVTMGQLLTPALDARLRPAGITTFELGALVVLDDEPARALRISEIASALCATLPHMSKVIGKLASRDLVDRAPSPDDARVTRVTITEAGRRLVVDAGPIYADAARSLILDRLAPEQLVALGDTLEPVIRALDPNRPDERV